MYYWGVRRRWLPRRVVLYALGGSIISGCIVAVLVWAHLRSPIPATLRHDIQFGIFLPETSAHIEQASYKYDKSLGVLSFTARLPSGQIATFAEQATPEAFTDIPTYYDKLLTKLHNYSTFDTPIGTVHLTHPTGVGQAAVMSTKGTLLFVRVDHDEPITTWRQLFGHMVTYQP